MQALSLYLVYHLNIISIKEKGRIQVLVNNIAKKELISGNGFGELALLYSAPR